MFTIALVQAVTWALTLSPALASATLLARFIIGQGVRRAANNFCSGCGARNAGPNPYPKPKPKLKPKPKPKPKP